ncbi:dihydroorotate dehydrogenase [Helicosporidium sp. ATCC 50920]|nr:dihydroorotate dehydrogenase [Helicosporidium sp. ATCC 50920]|eukprot:KDD75314.1 dihydroorotate dehydrogenase [Helicosporidium sp. ATCC 50920]
MLRASNTPRSLAGRPSIELKDGAVTSGPSLAVEVNGMKLPNPFVIASGPPGTNLAVMQRAFDEGWGGVIAKTMSLDSSKVRNVTPRYARLKSESGEVIGWENIELISDRPFEKMLSELSQLKQRNPGRVVIGSIMEEYDRKAWHEIVDRCQDAGVDALEINFSCPHGMPERRMGMAMGQDPELLAEVCGWIHERAKVPVWAKMTPNITDIAVPAVAAVRAGCAGVAAINTIASVCGVNLDTLRPEPSVEGYSTPGGYSYKAVKPIALAKVQAVARALQSARLPASRHGPPSLSGIGGVDTGRDAAEFILLGAHTVQVCTGVMLHGYGLVKHLAAELQGFMTKHKFRSVDEFRGAALPYLTTHTELVRLQAEALRERKAARKGLAKDDDWSGDGFVKEAHSMVAN